jgi:motility quorum-sensing regulator / GCU-specific mRNA interferase toxin
MEKSTPHHSLKRVKALASSGRVRMTSSARTGGAAMGFGFEQVVAIILALDTGDFYKSMTTHADHRIWQDVYRPWTSAGTAYLKISVLEEVLVISFKEL